MVKAVGIDLGTTNSVIAYCPYDGVPEVIQNADGQATTPSVIAFDADSGIIIGHQAAQIFSFGFSPGAALFKRQMGISDTFVTHEGTDYGPEQLSTMLLCQLADDTVVTLGERPDRAVITVPAYFRNNEREATKRAAVKAGLDCLELINEPTAAAITFQSTFEGATGRTLVYDLGGGTFDVSILASGELSQVEVSRGDPNLGGADWDKILMELIAERAADVFDADTLEDPALLLAFRREAEAAKLRFSSMSRVNVSLVHNGQSLLCDLSRQDFEEASAGLVDATLALTDEALSAVGIGPDGIDNVLLVGGSTRMPMIETALTSHFSKPPRKTVNPDEAVALGAALRADLLDRSGGGLISLSSGAKNDRGLATITDIANSSLGVVAVSEDGADYINQTMIPRGAVLPAEGIQTFRHIFRAGEIAQLETYVTQGEGLTPADVSFIGLYTLDTLPGVTDGTPSEIEISYTYDSSGIGSARARMMGRTEWVAMDRGEIEDTAHARFADSPPRQKSAEPVSILMIFDVSGSMLGGPIKDARDAANRFVDAFDPEIVEIGIGVVADRSAILVEPTKNYRKVRRAIDHIKVDAAGAGDGNAGQPFDDISQIMASRTGARTALVLADGKWYDQPHAVARAEACHTQDIDIVAIGFGSADKKFLKEISSADELALKVKQADLVTTFGSIAQVVSRRSGLISA